MKKVVNIGGVQIGGGNRIAIQSMTNTLTADAASTIAQINALEHAGALLVRIAVPDLQSVQAIPSIIKGVNVPIIGDFHFSNADLAIEGIKKGLHKIRINPGNMSKSTIAQIVACAKDYNIPIRVGVNKGSTKGHSTPSKLAQLTADCAKLIEDLGYDNIVLAVKSSNVLQTIEANRHLDKLSRYPLHIALTESGYGEFAAIKSAIAIGALLADGIGDTIRVSIAGNPIKEVEIAKSILRAAGKEQDFAEIIACPTCARCTVDIEYLAQEIDALAQKLTIPLKIAVMGCIVNGIGEGKDADFGVAAGKERSVIFLKGKPYKTVENNQILEEIKALLEKIAK